MPLEAATTKSASVKPASKPAKRKRTAPGSFPEAIPLSDLKRFVEVTSIESLAEEKRISPLDLVRSLPRSMCRLAPAGALLEVMSAAATWGQMRILLSNAGSVIEVTTEIPQPQQGHHYVYLLGHGPICGRLRIDVCAGVAFIEREFLGKLSPMLLVFDTTGHVMFKILPARGDLRSLRDSQIQAMRELARQVGRPAK